MYSDNKKFPDEINQLSSSPLYNSGEEEIHLRDYWRMISKRRWTVIAIFVIFLVTGAIITFRQIPLYKATAKIQIDSENPNVLKIEEVINLAPSKTEYYQTQYKILQSRNLAKAVIEKLQLDKSPEFVSKESNEGLASVLGKINPSKIIHSFFILFKTKEAEDTNLSAEEKKSAKLFKLTNAFLLRLEIEPERNTRLINVSFKGKDPKIITNITNTLANLFIEHDLQLKFSASTEALKWLDTQLGQLKKTVEQSETELHEYKKENNIVSLEEKQDIIVQRLSELNTALTNAKTKRIKLETLYNRVTKYTDNLSVLESLPTVINNQLIQDLKSDYISLQVEHQKISGKYGDKHPHMIEILSKMELIKKKIRAEVKNIVNSIKTEYEIALAEEKILKDALEDQKKEAMELNQKAIRYGVLKREAESNQLVFNEVLNRFKETDLTRGLNTTNIRIVDPAEVPQIPIKPNKQLNILLSALLGLLGGIGLAFFFEYLDDTIKTPEDIKNYFGLSFLGPIPHCDFMESHDKVSKELISYYHPKSQISESYKGLRTSILFSIPGEGGKAILITSSNPGEGKTITAANLAITLAQAGTNVCLIDSDMRKPKIHKLFNLQMEEEGLSSYLIGQKTLDQVIYETFMPSLKIIPCGHRPPNPSELLASSQMNTLIGMLRKQFDFILIDSPPIVAVTDSVMLSRLADGVCMIIKGGNTSKEVIKMALETLKNARAHVIGAVINNIDIGKKSYSYYYQYYYYSYYGDVVKKDRKKGRIRHKKSPEETELSIKS